MSEWTDKFTAHQIHVTLPALDTALTEIEALEENEVTAIEAIDRLRQVQRLVVNSLASVDPNLVSDERLNTLDAFIRQQIEQVNGYKSNQNVALLIGANNTVDNILTQLSSIPVARTPEEIEGLREAVTSLRRSLGQHARNLETEYEKSEQQFKDVNRRFTEFTSEITSQKARLDTAISQFQQQFSEAENTRRSEYAQEIKTIRDELKSMLDSAKQEMSSQTTNFKTQFEAAEDQRQESYKTEYENTAASLKEVLDNGKTKLTELIAQHKDGFKTLTTELKDSRKALEKEFSENVQEYLDQLEVRKGEAEKLVQVIGNTGMVGGYQKVANQERAAAWVWHGLTFIFMAGLIVFAIIAFHSTIQGDFKLGVFGARAFVAIAFGIAAAWAAREAEKHQNVERQSRKMELELASINPYLALLPDDTQFAVKTELAKRFFGQSEPIAESKSDKQVTGSALDLLKMALEMLAKK
ncbi:MAG TPA: hypothetical protein DCK93_18510 [Blastocatellia bacterium]|jgi:signal transduction histidine kinase|nr:hypothetical protein [Blastocatellia bacterium]